MRRRDRPAATAARAGRVRRAVASGRQRGGQAGDRRIGEQRADGQVDAVDGPDARHQPGPGQRVPAECEEVVAHPDRLRQREQFGDDHRELRLRRRPRRDGDLAGGRAPVRLGKRAVVDLPAAGQRQRGQHHEGGRHHVVGKHLAKVLAQSVRRLDGAGTGDQVADEPDVVARAADRYHGLRDVVLAPQRRFDLAALYPVAADLDLPVRAACQLDPSRTRATGRHRRSGTGARPAAAERVWDEPGRGHGGRTVVAVGHSGAADVDLAEDAGRYRPQPGVQHVQLGPRDDRPDLDRGRRGADGVAARVDRGLGRAVQVPQAH